MVQFPGTSGRAVRAALLAAIGLLSIWATEAEAAAVAYRSVLIDGVRIAYRESGQKGQPAVLLLHGVPSSSRMYDGLMRLLGDSYHLVAPDYPGFGNSDAPDPADFRYTFDHLSEVMQKFTDALGVDRYVLFMQDYGAPVGMRMAVLRPQAPCALVFQNGNLYEEGMGAIWQKRRAFWADRSAHEQDIVGAHLSLALTRQRHIGDDPDVEAYDPDLWQDELDYLHRPGQAQIQSDLIYDYQSNVASYPAWQAWLRTNQPRTLVLWGTHDLAFTVAGARAFRRDVPGAEIHLLDAGHFAMDTRLDDVAQLTGRFLGSLPKSCKERGAGSDGAAR
jgi:pimeloyl-ACP methyl ester carboxylesterase